jgi:hypothetical protein
MTTMVVRTLGFLSGYSFSMAPDVFTDDEGSYHESAINVAAELGIVGGVRPATFDPSGTVRRDQMARTLARALGALRTWNFVPAPDTQSRPSPKEFWAATAL